MSEAITIWRIASHFLTWTADDLSGTGAALNPGRWNPRDRAIVYCSSSIALASLETVVYLAGDDPLPFPRQLVRITIPVRHWRQRKVLAAAEVPGWDLPPSPASPLTWVAESQSWGDDWLLNLESLIAEVPSVIVPEETNLLINPRHPAHGEVVAEIVRPWVSVGRHLSAARAGTPQAGPPWKEPLGAVVELEMVPIPAGEFLMGSPDNEQGRLDNEGPQRRVRLAPFSLARTPITQAQWREVAGWEPAEGDPPWERVLDPDPSHFKGDQPMDHQRPVECVSWFDAQEFCRRLSRRTGKNYTFPSESQWEYSCRAGTATPYAFGESLSQQQANVSTSETTEVGLFPANAWGLHDMHGNVWEWCADHEHENHVGAPDDGSAWIDPNADEHKRRLLRGGSWYNSPRYCRSAYRDCGRPDGRDGSGGFRVVCLPPGSTSQP